VGLRRRRIVRFDGASKLAQMIQDAQNARLSGDALIPWELPIVVACRRLVADTVAQLPFIAYRGNQPRPDQPRILARPDPGEPRWLSLHRAVNQLTRNGHVWMVPTAWDAADFPLALQVVDADKLTPRFDAAGRLVDVYFDGRRLPLGMDGAVWIPYQVEQAGSPGVSPITGCWRAVEYLSALWEMAGSFWEAGFPSIALEVVQRLTPDQKSETKQELLSAWSRRHEPAIVDGDAKLSPLGSNAVDSQLIESIGAANVEIARAFGVVPSLVNVDAGASLTYSTTEGEFRRWLAIGLAPYLTRLEGGFSELVPYGTTVRADTSALLRSDLQARYAAYSIAIDGGWLTVNEVRQTEGLPPFAAPSASTPTPPGTLGDRSTSPLSDPAVNA
jgi:HK97 family phage portal protein